MTVLGALSYTALPQEERNAPGGLSNNTFFLILFPFTLSGKNCQNGVQRTLPHSKTPFMLLFKHYFYNASFSETGGGRRRLCAATPLSEAVWGGSGAAAAPRPRSARGRAQRRAAPQ